MCVRVGVCVQCGCWELDPSPPQEQQVLFNHWALSLDPRLCLNPILTHKFYFSKILTLILSSTSNLEASQFSHLYFIDLLNMKLNHAHLMTSTIGMSGFKNRQLVHPAHNWKDRAAPVALGWTTAPSVLVRASWPKQGCLGVLRRGWEVQNSQQSRKTFSSESDTLLVPVCATSIPVLNPKNTHMKGQPKKAHG